MIEGQALYPSLIESVLIGGEPLTSSNFRSISDTEIEVRDFQALAGIADNT